MQIQDVLNFVREADRLKLIERQSLIHSGGRRENTAEHSWHLALTTLVMARFSPTPVDSNKAVLMALLHDLVEIDAGDTFVYGDLSNKAEAEQKAIERLTGLLPPEIGAEIKSIWMEFEKGECAEAKLVSAVDRFLPIYSNVLNAGHSWKKHGVTRDQVIARCERPVPQGLPGPGEVTGRMLDQAVQKGDLSN